MRAITVCLLLPAVLTFLPIKASADEVTDAINAHKDALYTQKVKEALGEFIDPTVDTTRAVPGWVAYAKASNIDAMRKAIQNSPAAKDYWDKKKAVHDAYSKFLDRDVESPQVLQNWVKYIDDNNSDGQGIAKMQSAIYGSPEAMPYRIKALEKSNPAEAAAVEKAYQDILGRSVESDKALHDWITYIWNHGGTNGGGLMMMSAAISGSDEAKKNMNKFNTAVNAALGTTSGIGIKPPADPNLLYFINAAHGNLTVLPQGSQTIPERTDVLPPDYVHQVAALSNTTLFSMPIGNNFGRTSSATSPRGNQQTDPCIKDAVQKKRQLETEGQALLDRKTSQKEAKTLADAQNKKVLEAMKEVAACAAKVKASSAMAGRR